MADGPVSGPSPRLGRLVGRAAALAVAAFVVAGPLASLVVWSLAERWTAGSPWPQRFGLRYWARMATGDFLEPLRTGLVVATVVTVLALILAVPLGYALARLAFRGRTVVLLLFLLPQAFPQLPVFASATRELHTPPVTVSVPVTGSATTGIPLENAGRKAIRACGTQTVLSFWSRSSSFPPATMLPGALPCACGLPCRMHQRTGTWIRSWIGRPDDR